MIVVSCLEQRHFNVTAGAAFNELFIAALICNLSSPLGFTKVIVLDWWQCVWECVHMFGLTHAANDWRRAASVPRFGDGCSAWVEQATSSSSSCPDLYVWKRCFWHIDSATIPLSTLGVLYSSAGVHVPALFWRFSSRMVVLHELEWGHLSLDSSTSIKGLTDEEDMLRSLFFSLWAFAAIFCITLRWLWELCEDSQLRCKKKRFVIICSDAHSKQLMNKTKQEAWF